MSSSVDNMSVSDSSPHQLMHTCSRLFPLLCGEYINISHKLNDNPSNRSQMMDPERMRLLLDCPLLRRSRVMVSTVRFRVRVSGRLEQCSFGIADLWNSGPQS